MEITELQRGEEKAWDSYVYNSNNSTFYHQIGWRNVVARTYKHRPVYLVAKEGGEIKRRNKGNPAYVLDEERDFW